MKSRLPFTLAYAPFTWVERARITLCGVMHTLGCPFSWIIRVQPDRSEYLCCIGSTNDWETVEWKAGIVFESWMEFARAVSIHRGKRR